MNKTKKVHDFKGLSINIEIDGIEYVRSLDADLEIDVLNLEKEFKCFAKKFAWWSMVWVASKTILENKKSETKRIYARCDAQVRGKAKANSVKVTEKQIECEVLDSPAYTELEAELFMCKEQCELAYSGKQALEMQKDMLVALGANYRAELASEPVIMLEQKKFKARHKIEKEKTKQINKKQPKKRIIK